MNSRTMIRIAALAIAVTISGASHAADHGRATLQTPVLHDGGGVWLAGGRHGHYWHARNRHQLALPFSY